MSKKRAVPKGSAPRHLFPADTNFPRTHFLYEYEGERVVDPALLVEHGILLWHEQIHTNELEDVSPLWAFAEAELRKRGQAATHSDLEWLRQQVIVNALVPESWNKLEPYPYKGLLIAALYLQEARRLCHNGHSDRVWHIIALAYYNLGLNTTKSASQAMAFYAAKARAEDTEFKRYIVLKALDTIKGKTRIKSVAQAKRAVIGFIQDYKDKNGKHVLLDKLRELDGGNTVEPLTGRAKSNADDRATARLEATLNSWASPKGPYPEMAKAFAAFEAKKAPLTTTVPEPSTARTTCEVFEFETGDYHTRLINLLANDDTLSVRLGDEQGPVVIRETMPSPPGTKRYRN
ncbi:Uncharacterised protein [Acinetobacter baumannii]|nr:Uncharacterised protein [Acinetobacter baumannii]